MRIWNLTPHPMHYDDGTNQRVIPSDGNCWVRQIDQPAEPIDGMATVKTQYSGVEGIPSEVQPGDVLIVSTIVAEAFERGTRPIGVAVLVPDTGSTCKRDPNGRIVSVSRFIRK